MMRLQDYDDQPLIEGIRVINLDKHEDDGGSFVELARMYTFPNKDITMFSTSGVVGSDRLQINHSYIEQGAVKAYHLHKEQYDVWYVMNKAIVNLIDLRDGIVKYQRQRLILGHKPQLLVIPPGVAHGIAAPYGSVNMIYFVDKFFNPLDEFRLPWDYVGTEVWEISKG